MKNIVKDFEGNPLDVDFDPEALATEIDKIDGPAPKKSSEPTSAVMDVRRMLADDVLERALREPGNEYLSALGEPTPNDGALNPIIDPDFDL